MLEKHYTAIAHVIRTYKNADRDKESACIEIAIGIAIFLKQDNPNFDTDKFLTEAGLTLSK